MNVFELNRKRLYERLEDRSVFLLHSGRAPHKTTDQFYPFVVSKNFYYLTGIEEPNCTLLMYKNGKELKTMMFIEETTEFMRTWIGEAISKEDVTKISNIKAVYYNPSLPNYFRRLLSYQGGNITPVPRILYLDLFRPTMKHSPIGYREFKDYIKEYHELSIKNINEHLVYMRMFKNEYEIKDLKKAIDITNEGIKRMMNEVGHRYNEKQLEADFNHEIMLNGAKTTGFDTIVASGKNATTLHYEDNNSKLGEGDLILIDLGAEYDQYCADISRTFPVNGVYTDRQKEIYEIVLKTNKETIEFAKPGITWKELDDFSRNILIEECKRIELIKEDSEISKYYFHSIGHFLGLDTHDVGLKSLVLQEGMVLTIEPGLYIKEEGLGVRIEDNILITKDGCKNLSEEIIKEIDDIERFMR